eukprot:TRINITY_DN22551_c0_g1_i1.p1 TRINITY_DN22551_c0_g1~~TRINITY_DN22551_c0_g1_i1.p1  ORF type:complete len:177 (+),score=49.07 TRINITY_DN22551_c0_g1_i1:152-682(+)
MGAVSGPSNGGSSAKAGPKAVSAVAVQANISMANELTKLDNIKEEGISAWIDEYRKARPGVVELQQQIDEWMSDFDRQQKQAKREREAKAAADGWTLVTAKGGRKKSTDANGVSVGAVSAAAVEHRAKKKEEAVVDFYRFQQREQRRNEILDLRQKFEEDKQKIAKLKAERKFRPY